MGSIQSVLCNNTQTTVSVTHAMEWKVVRESDPDQGRKAWGRKDWSGDVTCLVSHRGRVFPSQLEKNRLAVFAGFDDGHISGYDGNSLELEKSWLAHKEFGVNTLTSGEVGDTIYLYSGSLYGELISWLPSALEISMTYQASAIDCPNSAEGFTSAGGKRDSAIKQLVWRDGCVYSGNDAGKLCKWDPMLGLLWYKDSYSAIWGLSIAGEEQNLLSFSGSPIQSQIMVGDLKPRSGAGDGTLPVYSMVTGRSPLAAGSKGDLLLCTDPRSEGGLLLYREKKGQGYGEPTPLPAHNDQVSCISISPDDSLAVSGGWDGRVLIWDLKCGLKQGDVQVGEYITAVCWGPGGELWAGSNGGKISRIVRTGS